jgi:malonyl-ACP decarboxylase
MQNTSRVEQAVVITGMGVCCSIGQNLSSFRDGLKAGNTQFRRERDSYVWAPAVEPTNDEIALASISMDKTVGAKTKRLLHNSSRNVRFVLKTVFEAYLQSQLHIKRIEPNRIGVTVAGSNFNQQEQFIVFNKFMESPDYVSPRFALQFMDSDVVGIISSVLGIKGPGFTIGCASASGNGAIIKAAEMIRAGVVDACIVVGPIAGLSAIEIKALQNAGAMGGNKYREQPDRACRPFDEDREGFILGEGAASLVVESKKTALMRSVSALCSIRGWAFQLDGNHLTDPSIEGESSTIEQALSHASISKKRISYINTHGTSSRIGDATEVAALKQVFGNDIDRIWINSTKGIIGHCLFSAGIIECAATVLQIQGGFLHPNRNLDNPIDQYCKFTGPEYINAEISAAISNSFGFGGVNTCIVVSRE